MTQQKLADELGIKRNRLSAWEEDRAVANDEIVAHIAQMVNKTPNDLTTQDLSTAGGVAFAVKPQRKQLNVTNKAVAPISPNIKEAIDFEEQKTIFDAQIAETPIAKPPANTSVSGTALNPAPKAPNTNQSISKPQPYITNNPTPTERVKAVTPLPNVEQLSSHLAKPEIVELNWYQSVQDVGNNQVAGKINLPLPKGNNYLAVGNNLQLGILIYSQLRNWPRLNQHKLTLVKKLDGKVITGLAHWNNDYSVLSIEGKSYYDADIESIWQLEPFQMGQTVNIGSLTEQQKIALADKIIELLRNHNQG